MKQELSEEQKEAVLFNDCEGAILLEASAGSGKTRVLTERVLYLLTEKKDKFFSVLCLTFTNKAADEMKERLDGVPKLIDRSFIGTFHDFCLEKIIRTRRSEIGLKDVPHIFEEDDKRKLIEEILYQNDEFKSSYEFTNVSDPDKKAKKQQELINKCMSFISSAKRELINISEFEIDWPGWGKRNTFLYQEYNRRLRNQNAMDYDDILLFAYQILNSREEIAKLYRRTYKYILIDEAQDLNYAQYNIIKAICGKTHKNVMMVGDPKQAIYGFNGASLDFMQKYFVEDFEATIKEIHYNYRSSNSILKIAQQISPNKSIGQNYFEGLGEILSFENETSEANWIISQIKEWLSKGIYNEKGIQENIGLENIAVLARNRFVFSELIIQLDKDEVLRNKYYLRKGVEKFEPDSLFVKIFDLGLRVLINPSDILHFNQIVNLLKLSLDNTKDSIGILLSIDTFSTDAISKSQLNLLSKVWQKLNTNPKWLGGAFEMLKKEIIELEVKDEDKERILFDLSELEKYWKEFIKVTSLENQTISNFRYFCAIKGSKSTTEGLTLASIHTVKGLEFSIVFLIGMNEGVFPDYRTKPKDLPEERNNAYVAVTRAKRCIYITYRKKRKMPWGDEKAEKISSFIKKIEI